MNDIYESQIYLNGIRSPTKALKHCCTKQSQLQRISHDFNFNQLQYCLNHSKMLQTFLKTNNATKKWSQQTFDQLFALKNISSIQNQSSVRIMFIKYQTYCMGLGKLIKIQKLKYDDQNQQHEKMLIQLWDNLKPKQKLQARITNQWIEIGFQANDPKTDFRGAGLLGLHNLFRFSQDKKCRSVFQLATLKQTQYFFCSAGLYFTMLAVELIKQRKLYSTFFILYQDQIEHDYQKEQNILNRFQALYNMLFLQFDKFWQSCANKSLMQFNNNLNRFRLYIKSLSQNALKEKIIYWESF